MILSECNDVKKASFYWCNESQKEDVGNGYVDRFMAWTSLVTRESENCVNKELGHTQKKTTV